MGKKRRARSATGSALMKRSRLSALLLGRFRRLEAGVDLLPGLVEDSFYLTGIGSCRGQIEVLLVGLRAAGRQHDPVRLRVDGGLPDHSLGLEVVEDRRTRIECDGSVRCGNLCIRVADLGEDDGFILQIDGA